MAHTPYKFPRNHKLFMVFHWLGTLFLAPVIAVLYDQVYTKISFTDIPETVVVFILFGFFFGLPTLLVYILTYFHFSREEISWSRLKWILTATSTIGAVLSNLIIAGTYSLDLAIYYGVASVVTGVILSRKY